MHNLRLHYFEVENLQIHSKNRKDVTNEIESMESLIRPLFKLLENAGNVRVFKKVLHVYDSM